jgi:hypothetical protein
MSLNAKNTFGWLHLTDLHVGVGNQDWLWPSLKHEFFTDIARVHTLSGPWETVIFSGDLTQMASRSEFDKLDEVLSELWDQFAKLGFSPSLISLPGNHDVQRPPLNAQYRTLKRWWSEPDIHEEFFNNPKSEYRAAVDVLFKEYSDWVQRDKLNKHLVGTPGLLAGDQAYILEKGDLKIGVVTLNSTWLQVDGADYFEKLHVGPKQLLEVTGADPEKWCEKNSFNLLASHHPIGWLAKKSQELWNGEIYPPGRFSAHLFGHMHEAYAASMAIATTPIEAASSPR